MRATHRRGALATHGDHRDVAVRLGDLLGREADGIGVERAGHAAVGGEEHDEARAVTLLGQQGVLLRVEHRGDVSEHLVELVAVRARGQRGLLGAPELGRSHELHGAGDLLDVAYRSDAASDLALTGHELVASSCS